MMMRRKCLMKRRVTRACRLLFLLSWTLALLDGFDIHDLRLFILTQLILLPHFGQLATVTFIHLFDYYLSFSIFGTLHALYIVIITPLAFVIRSIPDQ